MRLKYKDQLVRAHPLYGIRPDIPPFLMYKSFGNSEKSVFVMDAFYDIPWNLTSDTIEPTTWHFVSRKVRL